MVTEVQPTSDRIMSRLDPNIECALRDAQNCKMAGDYQLALNLYNKIIENDPSNARALLHKANVLDQWVIVRCYQML